MIVNAEALREQLRTDVRHIYQDGFLAIIEPATIPALAELAEALSTSLNDGQRDYYRQVVEALLRQAIGRLKAGEQDGVTELLGLNYEVRLTIRTRLEYAAPHFGRKSGEGLRKATEKDGSQIIDRCLNDVVAGLMALADDADFTYTARFEPPKTKTTATERSHRPQLVIGVAALIVVVVMVLLTRPWGAVPASVGRNLARLSSEAEHQLSLQQTPLPGTTTSLLGFGDAVGGRPTYLYAVHTPVPGYHPILDSFVDTPGLGDERQFLRLSVGSAWRSHYSTRRSDAVYVPKRDIVFAWLYVANDALQEPDCNKLVGPTIAINTRIRITIWNAPDNHLHIIRGWISADNSRPRWITDAAAVVTATAAPLRYDPAASWQYSTSPSRFAKEAPLPSQDFFDAGGMELSSNGLLGSCWTNRWVFVLAFRQ